MSDCIFCKIGARQIPAMVVHDEDEALRSLRNAAETQLGRHVLSVASVEGRDLRARFERR